MTFFLITYRGTGVVVLDKFYISQDAGQDAGQEAGQDAISSARDKQQAHAEKSRRRRAGA